MSLVSYPSASSESGESDSGNDAENRSFFFPFKNSDRSSTFMGEIESECESIRPNSSKNTQDEFTSSQSHIFPRSEHQHVFEYQKSLEIHSATTDHKELNRPIHGLNSAELYKLCGSQAKRISSSEIDLLEIDGSAFVNNQPNVRHYESPYDESAVCHKKFKSSRLEKSKHQITFLAEQAKMQEREINLLRANRFHNKRKTQGRYGF